VQQRLSGQRKTIAPVNGSGFQFHFGATMVLC